MIARTVVVWIIVLASFLVLAIIIGRVLTPASYFDPEIEACAQQIKTSSQISTTTQGRYATEIDCPTKEVVVSGSDEKQKEQLAQDMVACHELWVQDSDLLFDENGIYCHVCSFIEFEDSGELEGLNEYMRTNPQGTSYMDQIAPIKTEDLAEQPEVAGVIDRDDLRATVFLYARGEDQIEFLGETLFSKDALERPAMLAAGVFLLRNGGHMAVRFVFRSAMLGACSVPGAGWLVCGAGVLLTEGLLLGAADYWVDSPPEYAAFVVQDDWRPEVVEQLGCEVKA